VSKRAWIGWSIVAAALLGGMFLRDALGIDWSSESLRAFVDETGAWAPLVFVALVALRLLVMIPSQLLLTAAGVVFGVGYGTLYGALGLTLSALLNFAFVHWVGVGALHDRIPLRLRDGLALARSRAGAGALAVVTGYPVGPITAVQMAAALTGMSLLSYAVAVCCGSAVRAATFSYFGSTLLEGQHVLIGLAVIVAAAAVPLLFPRSRAWLRQTTAKADGG
jgi:uncharacterized membrane protein YdjX (TVP38/TMEM64 family)